MSTFSGKMSEIPEISIDRFDGENLKSEAFFLSHCHTDHMQGLENPEFQQYLIGNNYFLYVSHISAAILKLMYPDISDNLIELDQYSPTTVALKNKYISVMPIPAGHCPGSVMFLFEGDKNILYTGDYRLNPHDLHKIEAFRDAFGKQKIIDVLYLDTTFFFKDYLIFPSRQKSLEEICTIIEEWVSKSDRHVVSLETSAKYGYEYLFIEISKYFKMPIHVNEETYEFCSRIPELDKAVTRFKNKTKIHSACGTTWRVICANTIYYNIKTIRVSAMRWKNENLQKGISDICYNKHNVCYSTHASYNEGAQLLQFLKPKRVKPNVLGNTYEINKEIYDNIKENLQIVQEPPRTKKIKLFEVNNDEVNLNESGGTDSSNSEIFDSPPRKYCDKKSTKENQDPREESVLLEFFKPLTSEQEISYSSPKKNKCINEDTCASNDNSVLLQFFRFNQIHEEISTQSTTTNIKLNQTKEIIEISSQESDVICINDSPPI